MYEHPNTAFSINGIAGTVLPKQLSVLVGYLSPLFSPGIKLLFIPHPVHSLAILQERQCTLKGQARYVNVRGSVHCKGVYRVGDKYLVKKSGDR